MGDKLKTTTTIDTEFAAFLSIDNGETWRKIHAFTARSTNEAEMYIKEMRDRYGLEHNEIYKVMQRQRVVSISEWEDVEWAKN